MAVVPPATFAESGAPAPDPPLPDDNRTLLEYLRTVYEARWLVLAIIAATLAAGFVYLAIATPIYRSTALVQVEDVTRSAAVLDELSTMLGDKVPAETEIEIIRSRSSLGSVVDELRLDEVARPRTFPLIGAAARRLHRGAGVAKAPLGLRRFAWGGERLRVERLAVENGLLGMPLTLTAAGEGEFRITADGTSLGAGRVGELLVATHEGSRVELYVSELVAEPGTEFVLARRRRDVAVQALQSGLRVYERGKKTGILVLEYQGSDPKKIAEILDAVSNRYVRQNVERRSAEAAKTLEFLAEQLPVLKEKLDAAEARLNAYQVAKGTVSLSLEAQSLLQRSIEVERALSDIDIQRAELRQRFSGAHPALSSLDEKAAKLNAQRSAVEQKLKALPDTELESARLSRDVKVSNELYSVLLNRAQELRILKSGTIGNVRILDPALVPATPDLPRRSVVLGLCLVAGISLGVAGAFVRAVVRTRLDDPDEVERVTGLPVYAAIPHSSEQAARSRQAGNGWHGSVASSTAGDLVAESFRSLRTSLQFAVAEPRRNIVVVSGPAPQVGKSFVAKNLAIVLAAADYRVVLVDADLRRGKLHRGFGLPRSPGLSEMIAGNAAPASAIHATKDHGLDFIPTGAISPNPSELLNSRRFAQLLADLSARYDFVVIDTPPILAVTDMALVARAQSVNLLVLRAGRHRLADVTHAVRILARHGVRANGAILNDIKLARGRYGASGRYRVYDYRSPA